MRRTGQRYWTGAATALVGLGLTGCADFWEEVTSHQHTFKEKITLIYSKPEPLEVLRTSSDGDDRAKAIQQLQEPKQHGGSDQEQELIVDVLARTATMDPQPFCRLAAIETLGRFKDPRVPGILKAAFYFEPIKKDSGDFDNIPSEYVDVKARIQCVTLKAMGETRNPEVVDLLTQVLREPPADSRDENQRRGDRRAAATRSLANFNTPRSTDALLRLLQGKDENVVLRDCAYTSLRKATGNTKLPPDATAWAAYLHPQNDNEPKKKEKIIDLASWFHKATPPASPGGGTPAPGAASNGGTPAPDAAPTGGMPAPDAAPTGSTAAAPAGLNGSAPAPDALPGGVPPPGGANGSAAAPDPASNGSIPAPAASANGGVPAPEPAPNAGASDAANPGR